MNRPETDCAAEVKSLHTMESRRRFLVSVCMYPGAALRRAVPTRTCFTRETNAEISKRANFGRVLLITTSDAHSRHFTVCARRHLPSTVRTWYIPRKIAYGELLCVLVLLNVNTNYLSYCRCASFICTPSIIIYHSRLTKAMFE